MNGHSSSRTSEFGIFELTNDSNVMLENRFISVHRENPVEDAQNIFPQKVDTENSFDFIKEIREPLLQGEKVDEKDIISSLDTFGSGRFAVVSRVEWQGKKYAYKKFLPKDDDYIVFKVFHAEWKHVQPLDHPNIVKVFAYTNKGYLMEIMDGSLIKLLKTFQDMELEDIFDICTQICIGLKCLYEKGICQKIY